MKNILEFKQIIEQELKEIKIPNRPENLYQPINYILSLDAKRIRAIALLMAHQLYNDDYKNENGSIMLIKFPKPDKKVTKEAIKIMIKLS